MPVPETMEQWDANGIALSCISLASYDHKRTPGMLIENEPMEEIVEPRHLRSSRIVVSI
jgi:hypothetical protein